MLRTCGQNGFNTCAEVVKRRFQADFLEIRNRRKSGWFPEDSARNTGSSMSRFWIFLKV